MAYQLILKKQTKILSRATLASASIGTLFPGSIIAESKTGDFYKLKDRDGYILANNPDNVEVTSLAVDGGKKATETILPGTERQQLLNRIVGGQVDLEDVIESSLEKILVSQMESTAKFDASMRLFGQPFQFTDTTDPRVSKSLHLGRKYVETFIAESPIVYIMPGRASYLPELKEEEKNVFSKMLDGAANSINSTIKEDIFKAEQRFFDFVPDYTNYMNYVNALCRVGAAMIGVADMTAPVKKGPIKNYRFFDWANYKYEETFSGTASKKDEVFTVGGLIDETVQSVTEAFETWYQGFQYVQFYVDPSSSFQESGSNNSGTSAVQSLLEKMQGSMKEYAFMSTAASSATGIPDMVQGMRQVVDSAASAFSGGVFSKILTNGHVVIDGGNMQFPEIWGDSNYNKSYNISINLVSPYGDKESIYLHVLVPLFHLLALSAPRQMSANGYGQPFFVKVSSKGWFNCELGIVESISIEKVMGSYSVNGLPTEVRVDLSIKDLYSTMAITSSQNPGDFFENKALVNWLAVTCGLDITKPAIAEKWTSVLYSLVAGSAIDIPGNIYSKTLEVTRNWARGITNF